MVQQLRTELDAYWLDNINGRVPAPVTDAYIAFTNAAETLEFYRGERGR